MLCHLEREQKRSKSADLLLFAMAQGQRPAFLLSAVILVVLLIVSVLIVLIVLAVLLLLLVVSVLVVLLIHHGAPPSPK